MTVFAVKAFEQAPEHKPKKKERQNIQAVVRIRPPKKTETTYIQTGNRISQQLVLQQTDYTNQFTAVLGTESSQADAFKVCGLPLVEATLSGQSTCLFAYGQTGSGKTFSMYGAEGGKNPSKLDGVVPAICAELFRRKQELEKRKDSELDLHATLVEVQGNKCLDLLGEADAKGDQPEIKVRGAALLGVAYEKIFSSRGLTHLIERGMSKRKTGTDHNITLISCRQLTHIVS